MTTPSSPLPSSTFDPSRFSTPPRGPGASTAASPKTPVNQVTNVVAKKVLTTPEFAQLRTPAKSHAPEVLEVSPDKLTGNDKREQRKLLKGLVNKGPHTVSSSGRTLKGDIDLIRKRKLQPKVDPAGDETFVIDSPLSGLKRGYKRHQKANADGTNRLFPIQLSSDFPDRDPSIATFSKGKDVLDLRDQWKKDRSVSFGSYVLSRFSAPPSLPAPDLDAFDSSLEEEAPAAPSEQPGAGASLSSQSDLDKQYEEFMAFIASLPSSSGDDAAEETATVRDAAETDREVDTGSRSPRAPASLLSYVAKPDLWTGTPAKLEQPQTDFDDDL